MEIKSKQKTSQVKQTNCFVINNFQAKILFNNKYNKKSVEFMSQSAFLSKLYEIKPFKIVESPETLKRNVQKPLLVQANLPNADAYISVPTLQSQKMPYETFSNPLSVPTPLSQTQSYNQTTPNKNQQNPTPGKSQKKVVRKYSNQQPASPHRITLSKKSQSINHHGLPLHSPLKTPDKENNLPIGTMIESHLYTNLTSSIDTLFSKIEKIKLQFEGPQSGSKLNRSINSQQMNKNKSLKQERMVNHKIKEVSEYSPILKPSLSKDMSSMSSLSPLLNHNQNIPKNSIQNYRTSYSKNKNLINTMYPSKENPQDLFNQSQSIASAQNLILPATHQNINEVSNKTRTIIDQINLLLDSNKKKIPNQQPNISNLKKCKKMMTQNFDKGQIFQYSGNTNENFESDELDEQFLTIKLKNTQSEYAPKMTFPNMSCELSGSVKAKNTTLGREYQGISYKIDPPMQTEPSPSIFEYDGHEALFQKYAQSNIPKQNIIFTGQLSMRQFELGKCVGSGKFGDVHMCKHKATGFLFALKKIFKSTILQYNMIEQFTQQLKIHYTLSNNHPNITKLYTHFHDEYHIFLLMEYIEDGTLMSQLKRQEEYVSSIVSQVLDAIEYIHRNNIAHRDLKPENILLSNGVAKLCDFGWSSTFKDQMRSTFCGTLDYVSPEMKDKGQYNTSVDLWSIGVLTFELLAGFPPHKKEIEKWKFLGGKIKQKWRWDVIFPPQISQMAQIFIQKLLKQNPDERISIRECRQQDFIVKHNKKYNNSYSFQFNKILG